MKIAWKKTIIAGVILGAIGSIPIVALAWHVSGATAVCQTNGKLLVSVNLSDNGPGSFTDNRTGSGTFGSVNHFEYEVPSGGSSLTVNVVWNNQETANFTVDTAECAQPSPSPSPSVSPVPSQSPNPSVSPTPTEGGDTTHVPQTPQTLPNTGADGIE